MKKYLSAFLLLVLLLSVGFAQEKRYIFEVTVKNTASKVSTSMRVFAENESDARQQVELNGWQVSMIRQITFKYSEEIPIKMGEGPVNMVAIDSIKNEKHLTDEELVNTLLGPPKTDSPLPAPGIVMPPLLPDSDRLLYLFTINFDFGVIEPIIGDKERRELSKIQNDSVYYVFGHTDNVKVNKLNSTYTDNFDLSFKRADVVKKVLIDNGADASRISTIGLGATYPAVANETLSGGTPKNRRVDVYLMQ